MSTPPIPIPKLSVRSLPWPTDWAALFGTEAERPPIARPLILEIGFGQGETLRHLSQTHPDAYLIGLEISHISMVKIEKRQAQGALQNLRVVFGTAETALHHCFAPHTLDAVHINFPDPWFKARHSRRRLMQRDTLDALVSRLKPGADLYLATDILAYAEMSHELLTATPALATQLPEGVPWVHEFAGRVLTKYERKAIAEGRPRYFFHYRRRPDVPAPDVPVMQELLPMPNMILHMPLTLDAMYAAFAPFNLSRGDITVGFKFAYVGPRTLLVETYVHEPTIEQRLGLLVSVDPNEPQKLRVRVSSMGGPRPTPGVHIAVKALADWLVGLHPDARVLQDKVRQDFV